MEQEKKWIQKGINGNMVLENHKENFYISHSSYSEAYGSETTSLVYGDMENFLILNGNHRKAYEELIDKGYEECVKYFKQNIHLINDKSKTYSYFEKQKVELEHKHEEERKLYGYTRQEIEAMPNTRKKIYLMGIMSDIQELLNRDLKQGFNDLKTNIETNTKVNKTKEKIRQKLKA